MKSTTTTYQTAKLLLAIRGPSGIFLPNREGSEDAIMKNTGLEHEEFEATFEIK
jgi:hypothetical protein